MNTFSRDQLLEAYKRYYEDYRTNRDTYHSYEEIDAMPVDQAAERTLEHLLRFVPQAN